MKAHICIGGPLDGEFATSKDLHGEWSYPPGHIEGMYEHLQHEYHQFNNANRAFNKTGCHVIWLHESLMQSSISPRKR